MKQIDWDTGLKARALWTIAKNYYDDGRRFEDALLELLGLEDACGSHLIDALFNDGKGFDKALKLDEIEILPQQKKGKADAK